MSQGNGGKVVSLSDKAYDRLAWAKKGNETLSDVIIRLTSTRLEGLQRRGEKKIVTSDDRILALEVDQGKCMGAESCVVLAKEVFALDVSNLGFGSNHEPLGMRDIMDKEVDSETVIQAARSCPYQAIFVRDLKDNNEQIVP